VRPSIPRRLQRLKDEPPPRVRRVWKNRRTFHFASSLAGVRQTAHNESRRRVRLSQTFGSRRHVRHTAVGARAAHWDYSVKALEKAWDALGSISRPDRADCAHDTWVALARPPRNASATNLKAGRAMIRESRGLLTPLPDVCHLIFGGLKIVSPGRCRAQLRPQHAPTRPSNDVALFGPHASNGKGLLECIAGHGMFDQGEPAAVLVAPRRIRTAPRLPMKPACRPSFLKFSLLSLHHSGSATYVADWALPRAQRIFAGRGAPVRAGFLPSARMKLRSSRHGRNTPVRTLSGTPVFTPVFARGNVRDPGLVRRA